MATEFVRFSVVNNWQRVEPPIEIRIRLKVVCVRSTLVQFNRRKYFELLASLVKVDQSVRREIRNRRVDHGQIREKSAKIRYRTVVQVLQQQYQLLFKQTHPTEQTS